MRIVQLLFIISTIIGAINCHAALVTPKPFNPSPSTQSPCGGGSPQATPQLTLCAGQAATITWQVFAADGNGPVSFAIDYAGAQANFVPITSSGADPTTVGKYTFQVNIPATESAKATLQAKSSTNWFSCSTVAISATACGADTVTQPEPTEVQDLDFCTMVNHKTVLIDAGADEEVLDASAGTTYTNYLSNPKVFANNGTQCQEAYKPFLCKITFPLAPGSDGVPVDPICKEECESVASLCQTTELHANLYPCDAYATCSSSSTITYSLFVLFSLLIVSLLL